jgi:uncharacterized membrane protein YfcA
MLSYTIAIIYFIITILFGINLSNMISRIKNKTGDISPLSILATISLILHFAGLTIYFSLVNNLWIVVLSQLFLIATMLYIRYKNKFTKNAKG